MAGLYISAAHKSSGKTSLSIGLCAAYSRSGIVVQPFKKGPDYIDPIWLSQAAERPCINLDFNTQDNQSLRSSFERYSDQSQLSLIEGNKGLHDGMDINGSDSNAALARLLEVPVILVIDSSGMTRGVASLIQGLHSFDPEVTIRGVVLNRVGGTRHEGKLRMAIDRYTDLPVVGAVPKLAEISIIERHLGLIPGNEDEDAIERIDRLGSTVEQCINLDQLFEIAGSSKIKKGVVVTPPLAPKEVSIGVARDQVFGFYYQDDLEALERAGAKLHYFSPLSDPDLPPVDGIFIGGGFPEVHLESLSANHGMREAIKAFIDSGKPVYAECGGLMYLCRTISWGEKKVEMAGALPADCRMHQRSRGRGYVRFRESEVAPWPGAKGERTEYPAHEFHYSSLENIDSGVEYAYQLLRGTGIDGGHDGLLWKNCLAAYLHQRDTAANRWVERFVGFVREKKSQRFRETSKQ